MAWPTDPRPAKALMVFRRQINALAPDRSFSSEGALEYGGMLGDKAHQATISDHNPDTDGVVKATDITKDLSHGIDSRKLAQAILDSKDDRVKYVISNGQIASGSGQDFPQGVWRDRNKGAGDHTEHMHLSLKQDAAHFDDERPWQLPGFDVKPDPNAPPKRPLLKVGSRGADVTFVQSIVMVDGIFGKATEDAVEAFQKERGLVVDGVVGPYTWAALLARTAPLEPGGPLDTDAIAALAAASPLAKVSWKDRGVAPIGYIKGMAVAFADCLDELAAGDAAVVEMAKANTDDDEHDAISWFNSNFRAMGWNNETAGPDTLRHLFVLLIGLGMRESSGRYCEGRDQSASNTSADTAEAGLFQQSWDSHGGIPLLSDLMKHYQGNVETCFRPLFADGVTCKDSDLANSGSGTGEIFQGLCKECPGFAVEAAALGLRSLRKHWGPINRKEVELRKEADDLLQAVQALVVAKPAPAPAVAEVKIPPDAITVPAVLTSPVPASPVPPSPVPASPVDTQIGRALEVLMALANAIRDQQKGKQL